MQKTSVFEGTYTCLHEINETDAYFDVMSIIQRGLTYELRVKYDNDIDFITNPRSGVLVVIVNGNRPVLIARVIECEKISCETIFNREKVLREYDINPDEWDAVLASDKIAQNIYEPMKRLFKFRMELTMPNQDLRECKEFYEIALELLKNIQ